MDNQFPSLSNVMLQSFVLNYQKYFVAQETFRCVLLHLHLIHLYIVVGKI